MAVLSRSLEEVGSRLEIAAVPHKAEAARSSWTSAEAVRGREPWEPKVLRPRWAWLVDKIRAD